MTVHAKGEPTLTFWAGLLFLHGNFFPQLDMSLLRKNMKLLCLSVLYIYILGNWSAEFSSMSFINYYTPFYFHFSF